MKYKYILTNSHVINGATSVKVKFTNNTVENVEIVGDDVRNHGQNCFLPFGM